MDNKTICLILLFPSVQKVFFYLGRAGALPIHVDSEMKQYRVMYRIFSIYLSTSITNHDSSISFCFHFFPLKFSFDVFWIDLLPAAIENGDPLFPLGQYNFTELFYENYSVILGDTEALSGSKCPTVSHNLTFGNSG